MSKRFNLGLFPRRQGGNHKIANVTVNLGSTKGRGSSTRMFNYCNQHSANPSGCINQFINIQTTPTPQFIYSFNYLGSNLASDVANNIPIIGGNGLTYTYTYTNISNLITVSVAFTFTDIPASNNGVYFYTYKNFYNTYTENLQILQFDGIPLSRIGSQFREITNLQVLATDTPSILSNTSMVNAFADCTNLSGNFNNWNTSSVTSMERMFRNAINFNENIGSWDTSNVTNMNRMLQGTQFNQQISNWNTSAVTDMGQMFGQASIFNQDISNWNTSSVTSMRDMFRQASNFNQYIGNWNTSIVTDMDYMFYFASNFNNGQVNGENTAPILWDVTYFPTTPLNFSVSSQLTLKTNSNPPGNSPFTTTGG